MVVEILYNGKRNDERFFAKWFEGMTALQALQSCADVMINNSGKHLFVSSINGVSFLKGKSAWLYKINGDYAMNASYNNVIENGDTITWIYDEDKCPLIK